MQIRQAPEINLSDLRIYVSQREVSILLDSMAIPFKIITVVKTTQMTLNYFNKYFMSGHGVKSLPKKHLPYTKTELIK